MTEEENSLYIHLKRVELFSANLFEFRLLILLHIAIN